MHKGLPLTFILVCGLVSSAHAVPKITAGFHVINSQNPIATVDILISDDGLGPPPPGLQPGQISAIFLNLSVGGGLEGPIITNIDLTGPGLIFHDNNLGQFDFGDPYITPGLQPSAFTVTASGSVSANGVLARVTFDATGIPVGGFYSFSLTNDLGPTDVGFGDFPPILIDGFVLPDPEPASIVMALTGAAAMFGVVIRQRRARRAK